MDPASNGVATRPAHPPNIHEIERMVLLRQALDVLEADEATQRSLYPEDLDPAREMTALYREAWHGVRAVFTPILPPAAVSILDEVDAALDEAPPDWDAIRAAAGVARTELPNLGERSTPRAWLDQIVLGPHHLRVRRQIEPEEEPR